MVDGEYLAEANADRLGQVSVGKSCVRFTKLANVELEVVRELVAIAIEKSRPAISGREPQSLGRGVDLPRPNRGGGLAASPSTTSSTHALVPSSGMCRPNSVPETISPTSMDVVCSGSGPSISVWV